MAILNNEVKAFIVQALACFDTPSQVAESVKREFGIEVSRQQVETHDPTKRCSKTLAKRWVTMFHDTRKRFREEIAEIPIANRAYRLRALGRMAEKAEGLRNMALAAQLYEQAAKESGGMYSNKHQLEHSGPGGGPIPMMPTTIQLVAPGHDNGED
ncbi:DUF2280 domain-containing protein [Pseudomonas citronellolis]|uniref:DUF2280 domain-containing protein n=1 Tax=Pseudomonas citronellolis TaxID=53408 RepID=A0A1A9KAE1_9PSED|nr:MULTISPECIES: DUF2280 domain-containing protein [Pseudomonas]ANI14468.1 hypothetical protein A9C11_10950 [Pseudomonas citronellolis]MBB1606534.1 hypothetical protein [Pseudomonas sp. UMC76]MBB1640693.1 hypothetical protein [Pseudomonas sp. UME83]MDF3842747.1 DUF2280 domain-containing protein [Pseudomonas citronellolis]MDN6874097.1 DUF2280 domain-containing protein [Pseudomonas citronellolis]